ncbi:Down syndrome cell adhesion molecule-like protein Dscam2, partial [Leptotrombidium deliense]
NVSRIDDGKYVCEVKNSEGEQRTTLWIETETSQRIEVGQELQLTCVVRGFPVQKDLKPINASKDFGHRVKQSAAKLHIFKVERDDQGCYQCFVVGDKEETSQANACLYLSENAAKFKETFKKHILSISDRLSLKCIASGNPLP